LRIPDVEAISPIQDLVAMAIAARPEIEQTRINVDNTKIQLLGSKSQLLPQFDIVASAQNNALAGQANTVPDPLAASLTSVILRTPANPAFLGGYGTILSQLFGRNYPDYSVGFSLNVPIRNRSAQADVIRDELTLRQQEIRQRQQVNQVRVDVQNALIGLQQARAAYQAAQKSRILQEQTLDAEQKKYALGASTIFFVIQAQRDLATAQAAEVSALTNYNRARVALDSATGQTLASNNISLDEALKGRVAKPPSPIPELDK
jgi:outer membrane protein TolC